MDHYTEEHADSKTLGQFNDIISIDPESIRLPDEYIRMICKIGQQTECCKYTIVGTSGFGCAKLNQMVKSSIDTRTDMTARADNCKGKDLDGMRKDSISKLKSRKARNEVLHLEL